MVDITNKGKVNGIFKRYLSNLARVKTPRKLKRLIYLSTILGMIQNQRDPDIELVKKLNSVFHVAKDPNAYLFPMHIRSIIWKDRCNSSIKLPRGLVAIDAIKELDLTEDDLNTVGVYFAEHSPEWIRYGSNELLINDVKRLLEELNEYKLNCKYA